MATVDSTIRAEQIAKLAEDNLLALERINENLFHIESLMNEDMQNSEEIEQEVTYLRHSLRCLVRGPLIHFKNRWEYFHAAREGNL